MWGCTYTKSARVTACSMRGLMTWSLMHIFGIQMRHTSTQVLLCASSVLFFMALLWSSVSTPSTFTMVSSDNHCLHFLKLSFILESSQIPGCAKCL